MLGKLMVKELKGSILIPVSIIGAIIFAWDIFLYFHIGHWQDNAILALGGVSMVIPFIWPIVMAFYTLYSEWNTNTVYLLLSLPVKGFTVLGSKIIAILSGFIIIATFTIAGYALFIRRLIWDPDWVNLMPGFEWNIGQFIGWSLVNSLLIMALIVILGQFAFLTGRLSPKCRGLITTLVFISSLWLWSKIYQLLHTFLYWVPSVDFQLNPVFGFKAHGRLKWDFEMMLIITLIAIGFSFINSWLFEKKVEL